jgi:RNA polymerase sigma factor (sigma-70 family)
VEVSSTTPVVVETMTFRDFYNDRWTAALRLAFVTCGNRQLAEDIAQDAFVGMARNWESIDNPNAYLRRSVVNLSINAGTRTRRHEPVIPDHPSHIGEPILDEVWALLVGLPPRQRTALALRFYEDLPEAEIARVLDCRPGTVKSLIHRGLAALRPLLEVRS